MKILTDIFLIVCVIAFGSFFTPSVTNGQKQEREEGTVVQKGQVTGEERAYSNEYKKLYPDIYKVKLSERNKEIKNLGVGLGGILEYLYEPFMTPITPAEFLQSLACKADAIVLGSAKSKTVHMTENELMAYTQYAFTVQRVEKDNSGSPIKINDVIQVTRPGGVIILDDRRIEVSDDNYEKLKLDSDYLLYLRYVPSANGYIADDINGDFALEGDSFRAMSIQPQPKELKNSNSQILLNNVRASLLTGCDRKLKREADKK